VAACEGSKRPARAVPTGVRERVRRRLLEVGRLQTAELVDRIPAGRRVAGRRPVVVEARVGPLIVLGRRMNESGLPPLAQNADFPRFESHLLDVRTGS